VLLLEVTGLILTGVFLLVAIAVLVKIDPTCGRKYKSPAYSLLEDFMNLSIKSNYTCLRCFNLRGN